MNDLIAKEKAIELLKSKNLGKHGTPLEYEQEACRQLEVIAESNRTHGLSLLQLIEQAGFKASQGFENESPEAMEAAKVRMEVAASLATVKYESDFLLT